MSEASIELDGAFGEGGGQILRTSLALSLLTGKPFHLRNIRAGRPKPGLQPQHLMCVRAAATIGQAQLRGAARDSTDLVFEPGLVKPGQYHFSIGTAGATGLVLQTLYLPLALAARETSEVVITGGTHVKSAPCFHFLDTTWRAYLQSTGLRVKLRMDRPGFYPRGGGVVRATIEPCPQLQGFVYRQTETAAKATVLSVVADLPEEIGRRQARRAEHRLKATERLDKQKLVFETWENGPGTVLAITVDSRPVPTLFFALGERGKKAERVADEAAEQAVAFLNLDNPAVDLHSADQIVLPLALAEGRSDFPVAEVTQHLLTNVATIRRFVDRDIACEGEVGKPGRVKIAAK